MLELMDRTWTPKLCEMMGFLAIYSGFGPLFYILWGSREGHVEDIGFKTGRVKWAPLKSLSCLCAEVDRAVRHAGYAGAGSPEVCQSPGVVARG